MSSNRARLEGRLTQVGQVGRCITAARSLPGSWDAERQVHRCTLCTLHTGAQIQEGSFNAQKCGCKTPVAHHLTGSSSKTHGRQTNKYTKDGQKISTIIFLTLMATDDSNNHYLVRGYWPLV